MAVRDPSVQDWLDARCVATLCGSRSGYAAHRHCRQASCRARRGAEALDLATASDQGQATAAATVDLRFLFSADDSDGAIRAAQALVKNLPRYRDPVKLHLLNVQPAARREVGAFVGKKGIADYHHEQGLAALNRYARSSIAPAYPTPYTSALATCRRRSRITPNKHGAIRSSSGFPLGAGSLPRRPGSSTFR